MKFKNKVTPVILILLILLPTACNKDDGNNEWLTEPTAVTTPQLAIERLAEVTEQPADFFFCALLEAGEEPELTRALLDGRIITGHVIMPRESGLWDEPVEFFFVTRLGNVFYNIGDYENSLPIVKALDPEDFTLFDPEAAFLQAIALLAETVGFPQDSFSSHNFLGDSSRDGRVERTTADGEKIRGYEINFGDNVFYEPVESFFVSQYGEIYFNWKSDYDALSERPIFRRLENITFTEYDPAAFSMPDMTNKDLIAYLHELDVIYEGAINGVEDDDVPELMTIFHDGKILEGYHILYVARTAEDVISVFKYFVTADGSLYLLFTNYETGHNNWTLFYEGNGFLKTS